MKTYIVLIREVHISHRKVQAESEEEAKKLAPDSEETYLEYSHTLDEETWTVEKTNE